MTPGLKRLESLRRFQKCLRLAAMASTPGEAKAAERRARELMEKHRIDPVKLTNHSLYDTGDFADNALLKKLREEYLAAHPSGRQSGRGGVNKAVPKQADGGVNKARSQDRHLNKDDRHRPGYMRDYMRRRRAAEEGG